MCGICGIVQLDGGAVDLGDLTRMTLTLRHRGPDGVGHFVAGATQGPEPAGLLRGPAAGGMSVGLGHTRLAIIDLATGDQPMVDPLTGAVIVYNGETYNYRGLAADLARRGTGFDTTSDTEVVLRLYREYGPRCVEHMRGMFALAVWDPAAGRLFLARDRLGQKPLYYRFDGRRFLFASEAKAILACAGVPIEVEPGALGRYLTYGYVPAPGSIFRDLSKLPPAHRLVLSARGLTAERYWRLSYAPGPIRREEEAAEALLGELREAVRLRLISDVPLGAFLSGGVDSSAVVSLMAEESPGRVRTFSIGFDEQPFDETAFAREVAGRCGTEHTELFVRPDALEVLPRLAWHYGEPFGDSSAVPTYYLSRLTRDHVTVALNGDGGDEACGGYIRYAGMLLGRRLGRWPAGMNRVLARTMAAAKGLVGPGKRARLDYGVRLLNSVARSNEPVRRYLDYVGFFGPEDLRRLLTPEAADLVLADDPLDYFRGAWAASETDDPLHRVLDLDVNTYLPEDLLVKVDIASMAVALEARSPFLDHKVAELMASLPPGLKVRGLTGKILLKRLMRDRLPRQILDRPKKGFGVPVGEWFRGRLRAHLSEVLFSDRARGRGWFAPRAIENLIDEHDRRIADHTERLWALLFLEHWARVCLDGPPPLEPPA
jgi:asparagine synthase (glutamine-hydrolysing)